MATVGGIGRLFGINWFTVVPAKVTVRVDRRGNCVEDGGVSLFEDVCPAADKRVETLRAGADSQSSNI